LATDDAESKSKEGEPSGASSKESQRILTIVSGLGEDLENALQMNEELKTTATATARDLVRESQALARAESECRYLRARVAEDDYLRDEIRFVEEERNDVALRLEQTASRLEKAVKGQDELALKLDAAQQSLDDVRIQLVKAEEDRRAADEASEDFAERLAATEICKKALQLEARRQSEEQGGRLASELESMRTEKEALASQLAEAQAEAERSKSGKSDLQAELDEARSQYDEATQRAEDQKSSLNAELNRIRQELDEARARAEGLATELVQTQAARENTSGEVAHLKETLEQEQSARREEAEKAKSLAENNQKMSSELERMQAAREKLYKEELNTAKALDDAKGNLSRTEKMNAELKRDLERTHAKAEQATQDLRAIKAARELAEDREQALKDQRRKDEIRIRTLERRVNELLVQREEMKLDMETTRQAMVRVSANVDALYDAGRRKRKAKEE